MNKLILNLSVLLSFALCGLCLVQWKRETVLTAEQGTLRNQIYTNRVALQGLEVNLTAAKSELARVEGIRTMQEGLMRTNQTRIGELQVLLTKAEEERDQKTTMVEQYKAALEEANSNIQQLNAAVIKRDEAIKQVVGDRDQRIEEYNKLGGEYKKLAEEYSKVVGEYNKLVDDVKAANEAAAKTRK
jgi:chromosome segregation ATPase